MVDMLRQGQMEQIQSISDKFEQSFSRLTDMLTTVFQASGERKRRSGSAVTDTPPCKSVRLSHIDSEGDQHASLSTKACDFSDSVSSNDEDAVSIPEETSLERDIAGLLEEEPTHKAIESQATSEAILDSIEALEMEFHQSKVLVQLHFLVKSTGTIALKWWPNFPTR